MSEILIWLIRLLWYNSIYKDTTHLEPNSNIFMILNTKRNLWNTILHVVSVLGQIYFDLGRVEIAQKFKSIELWVAVLPHFDYWFRSVLVTSEKDNRGLPSGWESANAFHADDLKPPTQTEIGDDDAAVGRDAECPLGSRFVANCRPARFWKMANIKIN